MRIDWAELCLEIISQRHLVVAEAHQTDLASSRFCRMNRRLTAVSVLLASITGLCACSAINTPTSTLSVGSAGSFRRAMGAQVGSQLLYRVVYSDSKYERQC